MARRNRISAAATTVNGSSTFMKLPTEIRLNIYRWALSTTQKRPLRRLAEFQHRYEPMNTAILRTSQKIHQEALPVFYGINTFHFSLDTYDPTLPNGLSKHYQLHLKHVSIDTMWHTSEAGDTKISTYLDDLTKKCPALKTFTLHLLPGGHYHMMPTIPVLVSSDWAKRSVPLLHNLRLKLDRLSIVTFCPVESLIWLREQINDGKDSWLSERHQYWPGINLNIYQQQLLSFSGRRGSVALPNQLYAPGAEISSFHTYRPGLRRYAKKEKVVGLEIETLE